MMHASALAAAVVTVTSGEAVMSAEDTCVYNCAVSVDAELVVVRPFARTDIGNVVSSFERWNDFPPCDIESTISTKADLIL